MTKSLCRPEVIITHESDLDGLVSGVLLQRLARKLFNTDVPLEAYQYNNQWRQRELRKIHDLQRANAGSLRRIARRRQYWRAAVLGRRRAPRIVV